ncbi:hypothetical protein CFN78_16540 [Amycolatopsis antarctica]|uniref:Tryptophan 2,3-dioxygenase n=1 Tax=Amycolatopsis antarctica TaxID=1854586 RepID=A0A263D0Z8_9PSEU|nr:tryptophan 2,3-dioxygenase family protein [Amycolatopsis antarctica]OZM72144.1 hypothetical protein CFN78_16540 [Amycolatopsis antarctica]
MVALTKSSGDSAALTYDSYLQLGKVLSAQAPVGDDPDDELHFIVAHQAIELWFSQVVREVRRARDAMLAVSIEDAVVHLERATAFVDVVTAQLDTLMLLPVDVFRRLRQYLGTSSGLQSLQFRVIEALSGGETGSARRRLRVAFPRGIPAPVEAAFAEGSLRGAHVALPAHVHESEAGGRVVAALVAYDKAWVGWRLRHAQLVMHMIGRHATGTGGTDLRYLTRRVEASYFPHLPSNRKRS